MKSAFIAGMLAVILALPAPGQAWKPERLPQAGADGFVLVRGGIFWSGDVVTRRDRQNQERVEDFEILDHPVTNTEYRQFIRATGHPFPLHWTQGEIPKGFENHPVIYVNRYDADAYIAWRSQSERRVYRLPTDGEFEYAARGGADKQPYPWGSGGPQGQANFDAGDNRLYSDWGRYLQPVKTGAPNGYALYDMAGNVWQMVNTYPDAGRARYKYRLETPTDLEGRIVGGSWARSAEYLRCGYGASASPGQRLPDLGFRIVREPAAGAPGFHTLPRRIAAFSAGTGQIYLSWQLLSTDRQDTAFNVYRSTRRDVAGFKINAVPVSDSTNYLDSGVTSGRLYYYYCVRALLPDGREGFSSEWAGVEAADKAGALWMSFTPFPRKTGAAPVFGDLDGNGLLDVVIRLDNGNVEMSKDSGLPVEIEAFLDNGRWLWRKQLVSHDHCYSSASNVPINVFDLDGDGRAEIICRLQEGNEVYLAVLEGLSGRILRKTPWTAMLTDFAKTSTRIHLGTAFLDGKTPALITQTGLYENEVFTAYDGDLKKLWEFPSTGPTNGSGSHHIDVVDVDGDGRDEILNGTTCLNPDGSLRWSLYRAHPDIVAVRDFLPESPGLEIYYAVESSIHAGAYLAAALDGRLLWKINRELDPRWTHAHVGWAADIWKGSPGPECYTNRDGHDAKNTVLISAAGHILLESFPSGYYPVEWDGDETRELLARNGSAIGKFDGQKVMPLPGVIPNEITRGNIVLVADLVGDFRDELVVVGPNAQGEATVSILCATAPIRTRQLTRTASRDYRLWMARNLTGGYGSYYESPR